MKKNYLLACILLLVGCNKNVENIESSYNNESSSFSSSIEESSSTINEESSSIIEEKSNYYGYMNMAYGSKDYSRRVDFKFEMTDLISKSNTEYNSNLAKLGLLLSASSTGCYTFLDGKEDYRPSLMEQIGMDDVTSIDLFDNEYIEDSNDATGFDISHKKESLNDKDYEIIMVSIRGTYNNKEWISNFDIGVDNEKYYEISGNHEEWKNKENHKGFDVASNRTVLAIEEYIASYVDDYANKIIFITGHSRGGALSNLVGKAFEDKKEYKSFAYCFAPAYTTTASNIHDYSTIFNICNDDDIVCALPPKCMGFDLYGTTIRISANDYQDSWTSVYDFEYIPADGQTLTKLFTNVFSSRDNVFDIDYDDPCTRLFFSKTKAYSAYYEDMKKYKDNGLDKLCEMTTPTKNENGVYEYSVYICPYYLLKLITNALEDDTSILDSIKIDNVREVIANTHYISMVLKIVNSASSGGIIDSHLYASYYVIVDNYIKEN